MPGSDPTFHMLCGKMASGKSSLARRLAQAESTVLISEDAWLGTLFADQMSTGQDYMRCAGKLQAIMGPHVAALLSAGVSVVLDFPANTVENRAWMKGILDETDATHVLHVLDVPDHICLGRLAARNAAGDHPFAPTEAQFHQFSKYFVPPAQDEGFNIELHSTP
ncbi:MAG: ATP-binding protein [Pseudomonadota bacterium]